MQQVRDLKNAGAVPRLHPNGFVQLDMGPNTRLHVWPQNPLVAQKTRHPIHDHPFDLHSQVLRGAVINLTYSIEPYIGVDPEEKPYILHRVKSIGGTDTVLEPTPGEYTLLNIDAEKTHAGKAYRMAKYVLHNSIVAGLTVTLMQKLWIDRDYSPLVAVPSNVQPDNDFRRESSPSLLWDIIWTALTEEK